MINNASPSSRPTSAPGKTKVPWLSATHLLISSLQLLALVYLIGKWDKPPFSARSEQPLASSQQEANENLIKGWHETLTLLKNSDEANARLREHIEKLEERLGQMESAKPAPTIGPLAEKDTKLPENAKE